MQRSRAQLQDLYKRLKIKARKEVSQYRREAGATGGGPSPPQPDDISWKVADMIPTEFEPLNNTYDDDGQPPPKKSK